MLSLDTDIFLYYHNLDCAEQPSAAAFVASLVERRDVVISEFVLVELYILLRNPAVLQHSCSAPDAAAICQRWRANPNWRLVDAAPVMDQVWASASAPSFGRRRIIDARLALCLRHHGVTHLATRNIKDFAGFGFERVFDPLSDAL